MTDRERTLAILLLGLIFVAVGGFVGYLMFLEPIQARTAQASKLRLEIDDLRDDVDKATKDARRLAEVKERSLPSDVVLAKEEYKEAMSILLRAAGVPPGFTITARNADARGTPKLNDKTLAYNRLAFDLNFERVDLPTLARFLETYQKLNLSHRVTGFAVKRAADGRRASDGRDDLTVTLTTEAIVMDGAEPRRTLLPVPTAIAAVGGAAGRQAVSVTPEVGRGLIGTGDPAVLASTDRQYAMIVARDYFHGPLPPPAPPPPPPKEEQPPPPPPPPAPKEDIAQYVRLVGLTIRSNGTAVADLWDTVNNLKYEVETGMDGTSVRRYSQASDGSRLADKDYRNPGSLRITAPESSTDREFRLIALDGRGLYLADASVASGGRAVDVAAVVGGPGVLAEKQPALFYWPVGASLKAIERMSSADAEGLLSRAAAAAADDTPRTVPDNGLR